jgi:hypothetical protein
MVLVGANVAVEADIFIFWYFASEAPVFMVFPAPGSPGSNDNPFQAFLKKKESFLKFFILRGFYIMQHPQHPSSNASYHYLFCHVT